MEIASFLLFVLVVSICCTPTKTDCQTSFGLTACYGVRISFSPPACPGSLIRINSPRTTLNLSACPSMEPLTLVFDKECSTSILAARPIQTLPPECVLAVMPRRYRIFVSCFCLKTILEFLCFCLETILEFLIFYSCLMS